MGSHDWLVRLWNVIGSVRFGLVECFVHASFTIHTLTCHWLLSVSWQAAASTNRLWSISQKPNLYVEIQNHKRATNTIQMSTKISYLQKHNSKESERYQMTIVFNHWCIAKKPFQNSRLIRAARYILYSTKNRKLINQTFELCGYFNSFQLRSFVSQTL